MRVKQGLLLLFFSLLFSWKATGELYPSDAYGSNKDALEQYSGYYGIQLLPPVAVTNPKDIVEVPSSSQSGKVFNVLAFVIRETGLTGVESTITVEDANLVLNAERLPKQSRYDFKNTLPYYASTSVHQYFLDQSNGKFNVFFTVLEVDIADFNTSVFLTRYEKMKYAVDYAKESFGSLSSSFDSLCFLETSVSAGTSKAYGAGSDDNDNDDDDDVTINVLYSRFGLPLQVHPRPDRIVVREICVATAYNLCKLPPLYHNPGFNGTDRIFDIDDTRWEGDDSRVDDDGNVVGIGYTVLHDTTDDAAANSSEETINMAGFCLMGGLVSDLTQNVRYEGHPPSINAYYKAKLGWVDNILMDQDTKMRAGVQHEGRLTYTYEPVTSKSSGEFFMIETRQNRNYEAGTVVATDSPSRGIFDPDKVGITKDSVSPADGLVIYHIEESMPGNSLFFMGVVDAKWGNSINSLSYPNYVDQRKPWRPERDSAFRRAEVSLVEFGENLGAYNMDGTPNAPGGYGIDPYTGNHYYRSIRDAFKDAYDLGAVDRDYDTSSQTLINNTDRKQHYEDYLSVVDFIEDMEELVGRIDDQEELVIWLSIFDINLRDVVHKVVGLDALFIALDGVVAPQDQVALIGDADYLSIIKKMKLMARPVTQVGQYDSKGDYSPSGTYVKKENQNQIGDELEVDPNLLAQLPLVEGSDYPIEGDGYFTEDGVYQPGGGYEPVMARDEDTDELIFDEYDFAIKAGSEFRQLYTFVENPVDNKGTLVLAAIIEDSAGDYGYELIYKDIVNCDTSPALQFFAYTLPLPSIDVTEAFLPSMSNISPLDQTMTVEICNHKFYTNPYEYDHGMQEENGFLSKKFENELGVATAEDELTLAELESDKNINDANSVYNSYLNDIYSRYTFDINLNFGAFPENLKVGIWNRGGKDLPYSVINDAGNMAKLVGSSDTGVLYDRAETLEFEFDFESFAKNQAGEPFPWTTKFRFARISWTKRGGNNDGRKDFLTDLYVTLSIKSPPKAIVGNSFANTSIFSETDFADIYPDGANVPGVDGTLELSLPQYAQYGSGNMKVVNAGATPLRHWATAKQDWIVSPSSNPDLKVTQWIAGNSFGSHVVRVSVPKLIEEIGVGNGSTLGSVELYSDNPGVNHGQSLAIRAQVNDVLPPAPPVFLVLDRTAYIEASVDDILDGDTTFLENALLYGGTDVEVSSSSAYIVWSLMPYVTHYLVYRSEEKKLVPDESDLISIFHKSETSFAGVQVPKSKTTYYFWIKAVGINDPDVEVMLTPGNDGASLNELTLMRHLRGDAYSSEWAARLNKSIFVGERFSTRNSAIRVHIGPPSNVTATTKVNRSIDVYWSFIGPYNFNSSYSFQVWRSKDRNFDNAVRVDNGAITTVSTEDASSGTISPYFSAAGDLYEYTFGYQDYTADPYPQDYYYWVRTVDINQSDDKEVLSDPSLVTKGRRALDTDELFPIVDNANDDEEEFYDASFGNLEDVARGEDGSALRLSAKNNTRSGGTASSRYDAAIFKYLDFSGMGKADIVMEFDYKFEDSEGRGYITASVDGTELFVKYADKIGDQWQKTGFIDLSEFSGKVVKLEIGLVCDIENPSQMLWLDNLYVAGARLSPCWELLSSPTPSRLSEVLDVDYSTDSEIYSWNTSANEYVSSSTSNFTLDSEVGYWVYLNAPLKSGDVKVGTTTTGTVQSKLRRLPLGWSLCGPIKDVLLKDARSVITLNSSVNYLNSYSNLGSLEDVVINENGVTKTVQRFKLKAQIWKWDAHYSKYIPVLDRLEAGEAYWIFNY